MHDVARPGKHPRRDPVPAIEAEIIPHEFHGAFSKLADDGAVLSRGAAVVFLHETGCILGRAGIQRFGGDSFAISISRSCKTDAAIKRHAAIDLPRTSRVGGVHLRLLALVAAPEKLSAADDSTLLHRGDNALACERSVGFAASVFCDAGRTAVATCSRRIATACKKSFGVLGSPLEHVDK